jgi:hypothetical protein
MKISGNQSAIVELFTLLDKDFVHPFVCKCNDNNTHKLNCQHQSKQFEEIYGEDNFVYDLDYDGDTIKSATLVHRGYTNGNLMDGSVK